MAIDIHPTTLLTTADDATIKLPNQQTFIAANNLASKTDIANLNNQAASISNNVEFLSGKIDDNNELISANSADINNVKNDLANYIEENNIWQTNQDRILDEHSTLLSNNDNVKFFIPGKRVNNYMFDITSATTTNHIILPYDCACNLYICTNGVVNNISILYYTTLYMQYINATTSTTFNFLSTDNATIGNSIISLPPLKKDTRLYLTCKYSNVAFTYNQYYLQCFEL